MKLVKTVIMILLVFALGLLLWVRLGSAPKPAEADLRPTQAPAAPAAATEEPGRETPAGTEPTESEEPGIDIDAEPEYFTVSMVGDCTLSASPDKRDWGIGFQRTVGDDTDYPFANTVQFLNDDYLTIANLECSLSDKKYSSIEQFSFLGKADYAKILSSGSVEFVTLANNHTLDFGQGAYQDTTDALDAVGVTYAGENECYLYQNGDGLKIGLYCMYNGLTGNAFSLLSASAQEKLVAESKDWIDAAVKKLDEMGAEYTIACLHMGTEGNYETTDVQVELCRYAIDAGFGSVYCTHAHRLQPAELYGDGIIFYGLGNWIFGGNNNPGYGTDPAAYDTVAAQVTVCRRGSEVSLEGVKITPCSISSSVSPDSGSLTANSLNDYRPTPYTEGGTAWERTMSILRGEYAGSNFVPNYGDVLAQMNG